MFESLASIFKKAPQKDHKVLMIGPYQTGRTTLLYQMKLGFKIQAIPTMGFNFESIEMKTKFDKKYEFSVKKEETAPGSGVQEKKIVKTINQNKKLLVNFYDIGGADKIRALFPHYYSDLHVLVYMIDVQMISDEYKMSIAKEDIKNFLTNEKLSKKVPIIFLINKTDLIVSESEEQLKSKKAEMLAELEQIIDQKLIEGRKYIIMFCSAQNMEGVPQFQERLAQDCLSWE